MFLSPFEQFEIHSICDIYIGSLNFSYTNSSLYACLVVCILVFFFYFGLSDVKLISYGWQSLVEKLYFFILSLIKEQVGHIGLHYFPFIFCLFCFILGANLIGMVPYSFTITSHIIVTFTLAFGAFFGIQVVAGRTHGLHFFSFFVPAGVPVPLLPFLVVIEIISYIFRVVSLSVRLFANMMAGHTLLKILSGFSWTMLSIGGWLAVLSLLPLIIIFALIGLELAIAFLQAYVFATLTCIYLGDAINLH